MVDGQVCQAHQWVALLIMEILLGKEGVLCFREGFDGIVQRDGRIWTMDGRLFNFNDSIFSWLLFCGDNCLSFWFFKREGKLESEKDNCDILVIGQYEPKSSQI